MAEIKSLLDGVIETEIQNLETLSSGSEERAAVIKDLAALHKLRIEEIKAEADAEEKRERRVMDAEQRQTENALKRRQVDGEVDERDRDERFKQSQIREQVHDRYWKIGIAAAELLVPLVFYGAWMSAGFKFEEKGTYSSQTFKNLFNRFKPTKKS